LSCEPDIVYISDDAIDSGRARLVPNAGGRPGRYVEIEGAADLVVEIVSDATVVKDTRRLPVAYCRAGVRESWLIDARGDSTTRSHFQRSPTFNSVPFL
jgi:Uma2 family endonuclease